MAPTTHQKTTHRRLQKGTKARAVFRSNAYLSLGVSYPNVEDAQRGLRDGLITKAQYDAIVDAQRRKAAPPQYTKLGGLIYIHEHGAGSDWTLGCVALENEHMKELFDSVAVGTPVTIKP